MSNEKCIVSVSYFVLYFAKTFAKYTRKNLRNTREMPNTESVQPALGYSSSEKYTLMKTVYGNDDLGRATIFHWYAFFAAGKALAATLLKSD